MPHQNGRCLSRMPEGQAVADREEESRESESADKASRMKARRVFIFMVCS